MDADDYRAWLSLIDESEGQEVRILLRTRTATPDAPELRQLFELTKGRTFRLAVLTDSREARFRMTEFEWLGQIETRAFCYDDLDAALEYLNVSDAFLPGLERKLRSMTERVHARSSERATSGVDAYDQESSRGGATRRTRTNDDVG